MLLLGGLHHLTYLTYLHQFAPQAVLYATLSINTEALEKDAQKRRSVNLAGGPNAKLRAIDCLSPQSTSATQGSVIDTLTCTSMISADVVRVYKRFNLLVNLSDFNEGWLASIYE